MIPSTDTLRRAGEILKEIEQLQAELAGLFSGKAGGKRRGRPPGGGPGAARGAKRRMSPEARERIAAAAKARWARYRAEKKTGDK